MSFFFFKYNYFPQILFGFNKTYFRYFDMYRKTVSKVLFTYKLTNKPRYNGHVRLTTLKS